MLGAPNCLHCHKNPIAKVHELEDSASVKISQEKLCLSCHLDDPDVRSRIAPSAGFITMYEHSVHGSQLNAGNSNAANCVDCHNSHDIIGANLPESSIFKSNIPKTCSECHEEIYNDYKESVHSKALLRGNCDCPVCTDCHGEHNILRHDDPKSPVAFQNLSREVCSPCHSSLKLSEKYGIASDKYKSFEDSFHGLAIEGGSIEVANCASCHGDHDIKPSSDPTSRINKANLVETCGECHPGANENFAIGNIHVTRQDEDEPIIYFIATLYIFLIILTIGGMFAHNAIDFFRKARIKKLKQRGFIRIEHYGHSLYLRMNLNERIQHITLAVSFMLLVITGFMLSFPNTWWVSHIRDISSHSFEYRGLIHRISAVVMVAAGLYHIYYISFTERGRKLIKDLLPKFQDVRDAIGVVRFNAGVTDTKPKLDRFSYIEKAEYWALIWGTIVMSFTGVIMWFDNTFIGLFTKLGWDIARTIHYYEAWLAFLAVVVWHFYFVMFNPDVYPMNVAWIKGTMSEEEMAEEHPLEYERIKKEENLKSENNPELE
jgi:cytochrome b subunit of formate dehydrogenase